MKNLLLCLALGLAVSAGSAAAAAPGVFKHASRGVTCEQCHGSAAPVTKAKAKSCSKCHNYDALAKKTSALNPNPHDSHAGQLRCTLCHVEHGESTNYCKQCHTGNDPKFDFKVP